MTMSSSGDKEEEEALIDYSTTIPMVTLREKAREWLREDVPSFDFAGAVVGNAPETAVIVCKSDGVLSGVPFVNAIFEEVDCKIEWHCKEGQSLISPINVATVTGSARNLLNGERVALNVLARASGVATAARKVQNTIKSVRWKGEVAGTRKTTPGFRVVEKYSLLVGGISQHRNDLSSMVMLKDNHLWSAGNVTKAVELARRCCGFSQKIEVECRSYNEAYDAAVAGADIVMLDNFEPQAAKETAMKLKENFTHLIIEVSGGITHETLSLYFSNHIDVLSMSRLTQGYDCVDFSMKVVKEGRDVTNPTVKFGLE